MAQLTAGLLLSGLAMDVAGTSAPSSGGEHLVSHYLDMAHQAFASPCDLHGCQVGVATLACARLYERLLALDPGALNPGAAAARCQPWSAVAVPLSEHFGPLWPALEPAARSAHADGAEVGRRLSLLRDTWPDTSTALSRILRPASSLRAELAAAGAPVTFAQLGIDRRLARDALLQARHLRPRYTILDLAADLGTLEEWVDDALAQVGG